MPSSKADLSAAVFDALDSGCVVLDAAGRVVAWNSWLATSSQIAPEQAVGQTFPELFPEARLGRLTAAVRDALEFGASTLLSYQLHPSLLPLRTRTGRPLIHNVAIRPVGEKPYAHCVVQIADVTVVADRERVLRERQNARYDAVVETAPDSIVTVDAEGLIQMANPATVREFGFAAEELAGRPLGDLFVDRRAWDAAWPILISGGNAGGALELAVRRKDGTSSFVDLSASRWSSNARPFVTAILRDVNKRRAAEAELRHLNETLEERVAARTADLERAHEQLRQSQKMEAIGQLTGGVAHDFNNLLTPIVGGLDVLQRRGVGDARSQRLIEGALQSAERARVLVQRLLAFARRQPLRSSAIDISDLVRDMSDLVGSTLGPQIRIVLDVPPGLPPAQVDPNQVEMALLNLAVNARDAMPDGGALTISASAAEVAAGPRLAAGHYVRLAVSDTGVGMDAATLARAIEPFFSTKGVGKGTGLGLSMIHGLTAQLGGDLEISSTPGVGTRVEMWLPVAQGKADAPVEPSAAEDSPVAGLVLLVDDEDLIRASTVQMLHDLGLTVVEASSGREALALLDDPRIELILTDHLMPGMTGSEFAREAKERRPELPILVISGYADLDAIAPDLPRLMKPFRGDDLAAALSSLSRGA